MRGELMFRRKQPIYVNGDLYCHCAHPDRCGKVHPDEEGVENDDRAAYLLYYITPAGKYDKQTNRDVFGAIGFLPVPNLDSLVIGLIDYDGDAMAVEDLATREVVSGVDVLYAHPDLVAKYS